MELYRPMEKADLFFPPTPLPFAVIFFVMEKAAGKLKRSSTPLGTSQPASFREQSSAPGSEKFFWNIALKGKALPWGSGDVEAGIDKQMY